MEETVRLAFVDDDDAFREALSAELEDTGFVVSAMPDGEDLLQFLDSGNEVDAIVLDWRLQAGTALDLLIQLRRRGIHTPVVILTGATSTVHETTALDHGAVDFVDKARGVPVLARRIHLARQAARRNQELPADDFSVGDLLLRPKVNRAYWNGADVMLTVTEFNIVHLLASSAGEHVTYRAIYDCVHWSGFIAGSGEDGYRTNVRSSIKRIRSKFHAVDDSFSEIENFPAFGYRWRIPGSASMESADNSETDTGVVDS